MSGDSPWMARSASILVLSSACRATSSAEGLEAGLAFTLGSGGGLRLLVQVAGLDRLGQTADLLDALSSRPPIAPPSAASRRLGLFERLLDLGHPLAVLRAGGTFAVEDADLDLEVLDLAAAVLDGRRDRVLADRHPAQAVSSRLTDLSGSWRAGM